MKKVIIVFLSIFSMFANAQSDTLTNEKLIQLHKSGFNKDVLKSKIQASHCRFDVSTDGLLKLKKAGIPDEIVILMVGAPQTNILLSTQVQQPPVVNPHLNSGIHYKKPDGTYLEIEPSVLSATKTNSAANILVSGLINAKVKVSIADKQSSTVIRDEMPTIVFVFDTTQRNNLNDDNNQWFTNARSPKEFVLVKLEVLSNSREIVIGKANAVSSNMGIDEKRVIRFSSVKVSNGIYEIKPQKELDEGEYCIMFSQGIKSGQTTKAFDFSIQRAKSF